MTKLTPLVQSALTFLIRRGLTLLGTAGASVSDDWVTQTASLITVAGNEFFQWWRAHQHVKDKADTVKISS